jgi:carbonic anhydrase
MSTTNPQYSIDIANKNKKGECDYKCAYTYNYGSSNCIATINRNYISLTYDKKATPPVQYNNKNYIINDIRLYFPSFHTFKGLQTTGEMIIMHRPTHTGPVLLVCIPIIDNDSYYSQSMVNEIIFETIKKATSDGEQTNTITDFNLNDVIPKSGYYFYTGLQPGSIKSADFIVFDAYNPITITRNVAENVKKVTGNKLIALKGSKMFFNKNGPNIAKDNQIYIKCKPTGGEGETKIVKNTAGLNASVDNILYSKPVYILVSSAVFLAIIVGAKYGFKAIDFLRGKTPTITKIGAPIASSL